MTMIQEQHRYVDGTPDNRPRYVDNPELPETYSDENEAPEVHACLITCTAHLN